MLVGDFVGEDTDSTQARSNSVEMTMIDRSQYYLKTVHLVS